MRTDLPPGYSLRHAANQTDYDSFSHLARTYHEQLHVDLGFQNIDDELASLPGAYEAPKGCIILVSHIDIDRADLHTQDVACVAVRPLQQQSGSNVCSNIAACCAALAAPKDAKLHCEGIRLSTDAAQHYASPQLNSEARTQNGKSSSGSTCLPESKPSDFTCELKRLWVNTEHQHSGIGRILLDEALKVAKEIGYQRMVLETLESLTSANRLYEEAGFCQTCPYTPNPVPDVVYWQRVL